MSSGITTQYIRAGLLMLLFGWPIVISAQFTEEQLKWLESEEEHPQPEVNEGKLAFIQEAADRPEHNQSMQITVTDSTIETGWARVDQCHENLDKVERLQILFHEERVKNLQVTEYENIQKAWVEGHRVLVRNIGRRSNKRILTV